MEKKISLSTTALCISVLELKAKDMQSHISSYMNAKEVPSWMYEAQIEYNNAIVELKESIGL